MHVRGLGQGATRVALGRHTMSAREKDPPTMYLLSHVYVAFSGKELFVQNVMLPTFQETLCNFVAKTPGETPQEQYLRPRRTLHHLTM